MPRVGKLFHSVMLCHLFGFVLSTSCSFCAFLKWTVWVYSEWAFLLHTSVRFFVKISEFLKTSLRVEMRLNDKHIKKIIHVSTGYLPFLLWPFFPKVVVNIVHCSYFISCCMLYKWFVVNLFVGDMDSDVLKLQKGACHYLYIHIPPIIVNNHSIFDGQIVQWIFLLFWGLWNIMFWE